MRLYGTALKVVKQFKFLGHIVTEDLKDDADIFGIRIRSYITYDLCSMIGMLLKLDIRYTYLGVFSNYYTIHKNFRS